MFKRIFFSLLFLFSFLTGNAQTASAASVEESIWGVQTGLLGLWGHNESKLTRTIALRTEVGFDGGFYGGGNDFEYVFAPTLRVESRWYRTLDRRFRKGKTTANNSADYLSLKAMFVPDLFTISSEDVYVYSTLSLGINAGMRRVYWDHFSFELGLGAGVARYLDAEYRDPFYVLPEINLRFGYNF